jgi:hypothetical protein
MSFLLFEYIFLHPRTTLSYNFFKNHKENSNNNMIVKVVVLEIIK